MSLRKHFSCDLCNATLTDAIGIGLKHRMNGDIEAVYLHDDGAGHHLCNSCVEGLRGMLADLDRTGRIHAELDEAERTCAGRKG